MLSFSATKKHHLPDYKKLFKHPPFLVSRDVSIWVGSNNIAGMARLGVVVAKKNVKTAVCRNKAKRLSREIFKQYRASFSKKDLILVIKKFEAKQNIYTWRKKLIEVYSWLDHFVSKC